MVCKNSAQRTMDFSQIETQLLNTITALCTENTPFENLENFIQSLDAIRIRISKQEQYQLAILLWDVYFKMLRSRPARMLYQTLINMDLVIRALDASLSVNVQLLTESALNVAVSIIECVGFHSVIIINFLAPLIINSSNITDKIRWKTLKRINDALSVSSMFQEQFPKYAQLLIDQLQGNTPISKELVDLVISILESSASLIKIPVLIDLQKQVVIASTTLDSTYDIELLKLLSCLIGTNHEGVPLPIQIAMSILWRDYTGQSPEFTAELMRARAKCQALVRPRKLPTCLEPTNQGEAIDVAHLSSLNNGTEASSSSKNNATEVEGQQIHIEKQNTKDGNKAMNNETKKLLIFKTTDQSKNPENKSNGQQQDEEENEIVSDSCDDVIELSDDNEEMAITRAIDNGKGKALKEQKEFAHKTVDEMLMDFDDQ